MKIIDTLIDNQKDTLYQRISMKQSVDVNLVAKMIVFLLFDETKLITNYHVENVVI